MFSPFTEITLDRGKILKIGKKFKMRDGSKIRIRRNGVCTISNNSSVNSNNMIAYHKKISIGDNVQFSTNVQVYDHDHDYRSGLKNQKYSSVPIIIGDEVWIGANSIILKGVTIGSYAVIAAGSIVNCDVPDYSVFVQKRKCDIRKYSI